jgi:MFS family permease
MFVGLFMGLMPTIVRELFHIHNGLTIGATSCVEPGSAAVVGLFVSRVSPRGTARFGAAAMMVGGVLVLIGVGATTLPLVVVGGVIGGLGFGASYSGSLRTITPLAEPDQRAGLFAALFTVAYLAFGVPVIIAGQLIPRAGLRSTVIGYCVVTVVVATAGLVAQSVVARRGSAKAPHPCSDENGTFVPGWPGCLPPQSDPGGAVGD